MPPKPIQKLRIMLQINGGESDRPRWYQLHSSVISDETTPEMVTDILESLRRRLIDEMERK